MLLIAVYLANTRDRGSEFSLFWQLPLVITQMNPSIYAENEKKLSNRSLPSMKSSPYLENPVKDILSFHNSSNYTKLLILYTTWNIYFILYSCNEGLPISSLLEQP